MLALITLAFAAIAGYEAALLKRLKAGRGVRRAAYATVALAFAYVLLCAYAPPLANPHPLLEAVFGTLQNAILPRR